MTLDLFKFKSVYASILQMNLERDSLNMDAVDRNGVGTATRHSQRTTQSF